MPRRLFIKGDSKPAITITRRSLGKQKLVYIARANRQFRYPFRRSAIVYIAWLERAKEFRNPVTPFRRPGHRDTVEHRSVTENEVPYSILEEDARHVVLAAMRLLKKGAF